MQQADSPLKLKEQIARFANNFGALFQAPVFAFLEIVPNEYRRFLY
jgi:hypothetical protein